MAIFTLSQYLKGQIKSAQEGKNEQKVSSKKEQKDFAIYLESHNGGIHRYHSQAEWLFVENGTCSVKLADQTLLLNRGNLLYLKQGSEFEIKDQTAETVLVKLRANRIFDLEKQLANFGLDLAEQKLATNILDFLQKQAYLWIKSSGLMKPSQIFEEIINEYLNGDLFMKEMIASYLGQLVAISLRTSAFSQKQVEKVNFGGSELDRYIDAHFADISLKQCAEHFGFNQNYFSNLVKQKTGKSFVEHVDNRRMQEARRLLAMPNLSLQEIISRVGYSSKSFFYKKFSQYYGTTPAMMREELFRQANINLK